MEIDDQFFRHGVEDSIVLLGDDDLSVFKIKVDYGSLRAKSTELDGDLFNGSETAVNPHSSPDGWHDMENYDFPETGQRLRLAGLEPLPLNSMCPYIPSWSLSSEPLHDRTSTKGVDARRASSEATVSHFACPQSRLDAAPERRQRTSSVKGIILILVEA